MTKKTEAIDTLFMVIVISIAAVAMVAPFVLVFGKKVDKTPAIECVEGYKFTNNKKHGRTQMVDENGHGIPCTLFPGTMGVR